jgi:hypothetical protein
VPLRAVRSILLALAGITVSGCGGEPRPASDGPVLVPIDSVLLAENDSAYVSAAYELEVAPDGSFYVADYQVKKVHAFGRDGRHLRSLGGPGGGPGEFVSPGFLALDGDSLLYVVDREEIEMWDPRTAAHLGAYRLPRQPHNLAVSAGRLFAGHPDPEAGGSVVRVVRDTSRLTATGPFPELLRNPGLFAMFGMVALGMHRDTAATAFFVTNHVYLSDVSGRVLDSIPVPVRRRNGAQPKTLTRLARNPTDQEVGMAALFGSSVPRRLHWMPGGRLALVSTDQVMSSDGRWSDSSFVSVVDPRTRRSCVDARVPGPTDPHVGIGLRGDTLFVLAPEVDGGGGASTWIRWYRIDTGDCRWAEG